MGICSKLDCSALEGERTVARVDFVDKLNKLR